MRIFFKVVVLLVAVTMIAGTSQTSYAWSVTVKNEYPKTVTVGCYAGALGLITYLENVPSGQRHTFDTGAECPLHILVHICPPNPSFLYDPRPSSDCYFLKQEFAGGIHACWNSAWVITSDERIRPD